MAPQRPTDPTNPSPSATLPYPVDSLKPPLTNAEKVNIRKYLESQGYTDTEIYQYLASVGGLNPTNIDKTWIDMYETVATGGGFGKGKTKTVYPSVPGLTGIEAIGSFFNKLGEENTWVRIAEFVGGIVLVAISADIALQGIKGTSAGSTAAKAVKYVK